jgi:hypothetical protein
MVEDAAVLVEQLGKLSQLKILDISANPGLDHGTVSLIIKSLSGKSDLLHLHQFFPFFFTHQLFIRSPRVC